MTDRFDKEKRSWIMAQVHSKDTKPELIVRKILHGMGYRYRLNVQKLPGKPDIVLSRHKKIIFVHGCFWHGHEGCKRARRPETNTDFWDPKINRNIQRDVQNRTLLEESGWQVLIIWECEIKEMEALKNILLKFMNK